MRALALLALVVAVLVIFAFIRYLNRAEHLDHSSGTGHFSPSDSGKTKLGPDD